MYPIRDDRLWSMVMKLYRWEVLQIAVHMFLPSYQCTCSDPCTAYRLHLDRIHNLGESLMVLNPLNQSCMALLAIASVVLRDLFRI